MRKISIVAIASLLLGGVFGADQSYLYIRLDGHSRSRAERLALSLPYMHFDKILAAHKGDVVARRDLARSIDSGHVSSSTSRLLKGVKIFEPLLQANPEERTDAELFALYHFYHGLYDGGQKPSQEITDYLEKNAEKNPDFRFLLRWKKGGMSRAAKFGGKHGLWQTAETEEEYQGAYVAGNFFAIDEIKTKPEWIKETADLGQSTSQKRWADFLYAQRKDDEAASYYAAAYLQGEELKRDLFAFTTQYYPSLEQQRQEQVETIQKLYAKEE